MATKLTAHEMADRLLAPRGTKKHMAALEAKHGLAYVADWVRVHRRETAWAATRLRRGDFTFLDTETTGVDGAAEMTEVGIVDWDGDTLVESLIRPRLNSISAAAEQATGITEADVASAPTLASAYPTIQAGLLHQPRLVIYNAEFDERILQQSAFVNGLAPFQLPRVDDLMKRFARWAGSWESKRDGYVWWKLSAGHRAVGDCVAAIRLMEKMARQPSRLPD